MNDRRAGLILPLFSCPSSTGWGVGEIADLEPLTRWMASAGMRALQMLPIDEMAPGQQSPYAAISAMAIDPLFIHLPAVTEFAALGGEAALTPEERGAIDNARHAPQIDHRAVRGLKQTWLRRSFERFADMEWRHDTARARACAAFGGRESWWLDDHVVFRAIHEREQQRPWMEWPEPLRRREPTAVLRAREELAEEILFQQYLQWIGDGQWQDARRHAHGVAIYGDLPFMVNADSVDVWVRQNQFRLDVTIGAPPDAFSADGQDWKTPLYRWDAVAADGFGWLRQRARRCAALFDGFRVDHLVGFYRTYARPHDGTPEYFTPGDEPSQLAQGERILSVFRDSGAAIIAEDLGTVPDFVRESIARLGVPGLKVMRWERHWHTAGEPFRDPAEYPALSTAVSGTHDTEPLVTWWEHASDAERHAIAAIPSVERLARDSGLRIPDTLLEALFASGSDLMLMPIQDVFGWRDRVNDPSVMDDRNWVYKLPWFVDRMDEVAEARERTETLRTWSARYGR